MRERWPHVRAMQGGPMNPMAPAPSTSMKATADTLYRIHGTNEPESIGPRRLVRLHPHAEYRCDRFV